MEKLEDTFCVIPWIHSSTDSLGFLRVCCLCNVKPRSYLLEDGTPVNASKKFSPRNNVTYKKMRVAMLTGKKYDACKQCWDREKAGLISNRYVNSVSFYSHIKERAIRLTQKDGTINEKDFPVLYYDLRMGNKCNCKCIMCNPNNSSMWSKDGSSSDWCGDLNSPYLTYMIENLKDVHRIYLTGGEVTIIENHWKLLNLIIQKGFSKDIMLDYNVNGVVLKKKMFEVWEQFSHVSLGFSIDGIGEIFEQIRFPAKWENIRKNILYFEEYSGRNTFGIFTITVNSINILNILELFKWYISENLKKIRVVPHFNILTSPMHLSIRNIPPEKKEEVSKEYENFYRWIDQNISSEYASSCRSTFEGIKNMMWG